MATTTKLPQWPPLLSPDHISSLTLLATTYALSHGLIYLPVPSPSSQSTVTPPTLATPPSIPSSQSPPQSATPAPLSLLPSPFPRPLFHLAQRIQHIYNILYARVALDTAFLDRVMGDSESEEGPGVGRVDAFTGRLWTIWKELRDEDEEGGICQTLQLGIFRSDYLLHAPEGSGEGIDTPISLKQVEFNTISSSFGALSERIAALHNYLLSSTNYYNASPHLTPRNLPPNHTTATIAEGLLAAHKAYGVADAKILFVVQNGERNVFDQRWLEYELLERHSVHVIRRTLDELQSTATLDPSTKRLRIHPLTSSLAHRNSQSSPHSHSHAPSESLQTLDTLESFEISTIYFRAGYTPNDYPTPAHFATRKLLERSRAIKCPSIPLQLAGGKKVQQVLTNPGVLESFLTPSSSSSSSSPLCRGDEAFTPQDLADIRASWVEMWGLDSPGGYERALAQHMNLVLKPQREGGGNNVYRAAIPGFLEGLPEGERAAWIAMELIRPPRGGREGTGNWLVRAGAGAGGGQGGGNGNGNGSGNGGGAVQAEVVSELGIFGWALFGRDGGGKVRIVEEREGGWLLRTKGTESDEGGVAAGFSVLDSLLLVDVDTV